MSFFNFFISFILLSATFAGCKQEQNGNEKYLHIVLHVDLLSFINQLASNKDEKYRSMIYNSELQAESTDKFFKLLFETSNKSNIPLNRYFKGSSNKDIILQLKDTTFKVIEWNMNVLDQRLKDLRLHNTKVEKSNGWNISVKIPASQIKRWDDLRVVLLSNHPLEFRMVKETDAALDVMEKIDEILAGKKITGDLPAKGTTNEEFKKSHPFFSIAVIIPESGNADAYVSKDNIDKIRKILELPEVRSVIPEDMDFNFSAKPVIIQDNIEYYILYCVNRIPELTGDFLEDASGTINPYTNKPVITLQFNTQGSEIFAKITRENLSKRIAILFDELIYTASVIKGEIAGGRAQIDGAETIEEAKFLAIVLNIKPLAAPLEILSEEYYVAETE